MDESLEQLSTGEKLPSEGVIAKISYTHDSMIDMIIAEPMIAQKDLAARFGYTAPWVCQIIASDAFQARLAARKGELVDPTLIATLEERMKGLVIQSIEILKERLAKPTVSDAVVLRSLELGAKSLGMGVKAPVVMPPPSADRLEMLSENLVKLFRDKRGETYEAQIEEAVVVKGPDASH